MNELKALPTKALLAELRERMERIEPFKHRRWVRCDMCARTWVETGLTRYHRLRDRRSGCCGARMHVLNYKPRRGKES